MNEMFLKSKIDSFKYENDERFIKGRILICHDGLNKNESHFYKEDILRCALNTLHGIPILGSVVVDEDTNEHRLNGHDMDIKLVETEDGFDFKVKHIEKAFGFIPEDAPISMEEIDGRTYLVSYCVLWRNYLDEVEDILKNQDGFTDVSMEINVLDRTINDDGITYINDFEFLGVSMIGVEPGMYNTNLNVSNFSMSNIKFELQEMMKQYSLERGGETMEENQVAEVVDDVKDELEVVEESNVESEEKIEEIEEIQEPSEFDLLKEKYEKVIKDLEDLKVSYAELEEKLNEMNDYDSLKQFKEDYDKTQYESEIEDITSKFSFSDDEIKDIKTKALNKELSKEQYEKELYCLLGMKQIKNNSKFEKVDKSTCEVKVQNNVKISSRYGELGKKYSK